MPDIAQQLAPYPDLALSDSRELFPQAPGEGLPLIRVETALCRALIAPQGAQLLSFETAAGTPLLWLSPHCRFEPGKALRGGIPVCLPWFGPHRDAGLPQHGFARTSDWALTQVAQSDDGRCELWFELVHRADDRFPRSFRAELRMVLSDQIEQELRLTNTDEQPAHFTWALHSYLPVREATEVSVPALAGRDCLDNLQGLKRRRQKEALTFPGEVDRIFPAVTEPVILVGQPRLRIEQRDCPSLIAWNPGPEKAAAMADVGDHRRFVCLERGAVRDEGWTLAPGQTRNGRMVIRAD